MIIPKTMFAFTFLLIMTVFALTSCEPEKVYIETEVHDTVEVVIVDTLYNDNMPFEVSAGAFVGTYKDGDYAIYVWARAEMRDSTGQYEDVLLHGAVINVDERSERVDSSEYFYGSWEDAGYNQKWERKNPILLWDNSIESGYSVVWFPQDVWPAEPNRTTYRLYFSWKDVSSGTVFKTNQYYGKTIEQ